MPGRDGQPVGRWRPAVTSIQVYQLCLEGRNLCHTWPTPAFHRSRECFERAIRLEPTWAPAHFGLALYHGIGAAMGLLSPTEGWRNFEVALATARRLDETLGEHYNGLAATHLYLHRDWDAAERAFEKALEIDPDDAETRNHYGFSLALFGRGEDGLADVGRAIELDPLSVRFHWNLAAVFYFSGRYDDVIGQCRRLLGLDPTYVHANALIGDAYEQKGDLDAALQHWQRASAGDGGAVHASVEEFWRAQLDGLMNRRKRGEFVPAMRAERMYGRLGLVEEALDCLDSARHELSRLVLELPVDPLFYRFAGKPRFDAIIAALPNGRVMPQRASCGNRP